MFGLLHRSYSECLDITHSTECARTDLVSVRVLPCDIQIMPNFMFRVQSPDGFTLQGCTWARWVWLAQQAVLRRQTCVHDYQRVTAFILITFIVVVTYGT